PRYPRESAQSYRHPRGGSRIPQRSPFARLRLIRKIPVISVKYLRSPFSPYCGNASNAPKTLRTPKQWISLGSELISRAFPKYPKALSLQTLQTIGAFYFF